MKQFLLLVLTLVGLSTGKLFAAPSASAGSNQTITAPTSSITLSGSANNSNGYTITGYSWSVLSTPSGAPAPVINTASPYTASSPNVTGLTVMGNYTFQLTITYKRNNSSSTGTSTDNVTITVVQPTVSLSPSPVTITSGTNITLSTSSANFPSGSYSYSWSASPSTGVTIPSGSNSSKTISFANVGIYIITATVSRGGTSVAANDTVYVVSGSTRSYGSPVYAANIQGGHTMFGNTIMALYNSNGTSVNTTAMNDFGSYTTDANGATGTGITSQYSNDNSNMQFVNIDGSSSTLNSASSADLVLPAGTNTIKYARLYWGGHLSGDDFADANLTTVKIRKGSSGAYEDVTIPASQVSAISFGSGSSTMLYQSYADITNFVQAKGAGTYTIGNIPATTGSLSDGGAYGGWSIVVAYENTTMPYYSVRIYDAFLQVASGSAAQTVTLNNLNAPNNTLAATDAYLSTFSWEGDASLAATSSNPSGDYLKINGSAYSDAVNPVTNMWNGTISNNGSFVTTTNPSFKNQMGIDIDQINVGAGYGITPNATAVNVTFGTEQDQYYPSIFAFSIRMKDPLVTISKTVTGSVAPTNILVANETLTYVISGQNTGLGNLTGTTIVDTLPDGVTYIPGTIKIYAYPAGTPVAQTDISGDDQAFVSTTSGGKQYLTFNIGTGASSAAGGTLAAGGQYKVTFQVATVTNPSLISTISNTAYVSGIGSQSGNLSTTITNQATAIISPPNSLPIKLSAFTVTKSGSDALIQWTTQSELKNDHMEIQRSTDGVNFITIGSVAGNGTTTLVHNYEYSDPINGLTGVIYYRLRDVDIDGNGTYSKIIALRLDGSSLAANFSVYPNPFVADVKVSVSSSKDAKATIVVSNIAGQPVATQPVTLQNGQNIIVVQNLGLLRPGVYIVDFITTEGKSTQKIIKL